MEQGIFKEAAKLEDANKPFAIASIVSSRGSTPRNTGRMLIRSDGSSIGTVGGGPIEKYVIEEAVEAIKTGLSRMVSRRLIEKGEIAAGMSCGGAMEVFIDVVKTRPKLILIGGGHVNLALAQNAALLGYDLTLVEDRQEFAQKERFPMVRSIACLDNLLDAIDEIEIDRHSRIIIATRDRDLDALAKLVESESPYIGMLGSKRKVAIAVAQLRERGVSEERIKAIHTPVGLDIGAETPAEISISILAELIRFETGRKAGELKDFVEKLVVVRGAGDLATGCAVRLHRCGFRVVCLEVPKPMFIRSNVCLGQAVYNHTQSVEGIRSELADDIESVYRILEKGHIPILIDPDAESLSILNPAVLVDAILAKKNLGTHKSMAPRTIALGPGFQVDKDCHAVVETARGHLLGRVLYQGQALEDTGIPGIVGGQGAKRVLHAPCDGVFQPVGKIGNLVKKDEVIARIDGKELKAPFDGVIRGLLSGGLQIKAGCKVGDVDPRGDQVDCSLISDKANAVAGGVLEAILTLSSRP